MNNETDYLLLFKRPISESILEYATDNYTKNFAKQLVELDINKNRSELLYIIEELKKWYGSNLETILKDRFVSNSNDHKLSSQLLELVYDQLIKI